jgi:hypothetical protein
MEYWPPARRASGLERVTEYWNAGILGLELSNIDIAAKRRKKRKNQISQSIISAGY